jgi:hypothetical protein
MIEASSVWVFHGENARFAGGVFASLPDAEAWIRRHRLSGLLTEYPVGTGVYDWAVERGTFSPGKPKHREPAFIGAFAGNAQQHFHFENGVRQ